MSKKNLNTSYSSTALEKIQLKDIIKVSMPDEVLDKIKILCKLIAQDEWSGIILYEVRGSIRNVKTMEIILRDIIPMNKGSKAYTSYQFNEKKRDNSNYEDAHIEYVMNNEEAMDWKIGHIHSHNTMNVFFSGTDMEELVDNSPSHNFYFSLIVNNYMDFQAKVAFRAVAEKTVKVPYFALDENGEKYSIAKADFIAKKEKLYIYDCEVNSNKEEIQADDVFLSGVNRIIVKAEEEKEKAKKVIPVKPYSTPGTYKPKYGKDHTFFDGKKPQSKNTSFENEKLTDIEEFAITLLRLSNPPDKDVRRIDDAIIELIDNHGINVQNGTIAERIIQMYPYIFSKYFGEDVNDSDYTIITSEVIDLIEDEEVTFPMISNIVETLRFMLEQFEISTDAGITTT